MKPSLILSFVLAVSAVSAVPARSASPTKTEFQGLLQRFVDASWSKGFKRLGEERDFDHGHILRDAGGAPVAILYHTQELDKFGGPRSWIQRLSDGGIEDAARYERAEYPRGAAWDLFRAAELPAVKAQGTVLDKMIDPALLPVDASKTTQWVFSRVECGAAADEPLRVVLPTREAVCLALKRG